MPSKAPRIFLSHAAADKKLIEAVETLITKATGVTSGDVFCSSLEGQGVSTGDSFVDSIRGQLVGAKVVIAIITPAYLDSAFCMAELGAAWALKTSRVPIIVPPNSFAVMNATLLGIAGVMLDNEDGMDLALEELSDTVGSDKPKSVVRSRALRAFRKAWEGELQGGMVGPTRIEASLHKDALSERDKALNARDEAENEITLLEKKMAALRELKDRSGLAQFDDEHSDLIWEEEFENILSQVQSLGGELGGREILRLLILDHLGKTKGPDWHTHTDEAERAVELDVYDDESKEWNYAHDDVSELFKRLKNMDNLYMKHAEAMKEKLSKEGRRYDPNTVRFWEDNI
jgi:hypothetical protein